jgi:hypothetical protein
MSLEPIRPDLGHTEPPGEYLWDMTGTPDPLIADLERTLAPLAHRGRTPASPARPTWRVLTACAAAAMLLAGGLMFYTLRPFTPPRGPISWSTEFDARSAVTLSRPDAPDGAQTGQWITTGEGGSATLRAVAGATVTLMPNSHARVIDLGADAQRLRLDRGGLYTAPSASTLPIQIDTAGGRLTIRPDTACLVQLADGTPGRVEVKTGLVETIRDGQVTRVPYGCVAPLRAGGLGTPRRTGSAGLEGVLAKLDDAIGRGVGVSERAEVLRAALKSCGWDDHVTLWNLMWRVDPAERPAVLAAARSRTKSWINSPDAALLSLDPAAMEAWWNASVGE